MDMLLWGVIGAFFAAGVWFIWQDRKRQKQWRHKANLDKDARIKRLAEEYRKELSEFDRRRHGQSGLQ